MTESQKDHMFSRRLALGLCCLFTLLGAGIGLWGGLSWRGHVAFSVAEMFPYKPSLTKAASNTIYPQEVNRNTKRQQPAWNICKVDAGADIYGAFRELDCWITHLRTFKPTGYLLDRQIYLRFRKLYQRLQKEPVDEQTPARWKLLYNLGTRLYPRNNQWATRSSIPVYEMNGHHHAFRFWLREGMKRKLGPLFHIDSHDDMVALPTPKEVLAAVQDLRRNRNVKRAWHLIAHTVNDCSMPVTAGVLAGLYRQVIWGKSEDVTDFPTFLQRPFFFGLTHRNVPEASKITGLSSRQKDSLDDKLQAIQKKPRRFRLYYDRKQDRAQKAVPWNYAWISVTNQQRPIERKFILYRAFQYSIINIDSIAANDKKGIATFQKLLKALPAGQFTLDIDLDYFASVDTTPRFTRKMGSDPGLDFKPKSFHSQRKILRERLEDFEALLVALKQKGRVPAIITIADSTFLSFALDHIATAQSEFTPIEHAAFLRHNIHQILRRVYGSPVTDGIPKAMQRLLRSKGRVKK